MLMKAVSATMQQMLMKAAWLQAAVHLADARWSRKMLQQVLRQ
jgi:hypothetical protein